MQPSIRPEVHVETRGQSGTISGSTTTALRPAPAYHAAPTLRRPSRRRRSRSSTASRPRGRQPVQVLAPRKSGGRRYLGTIQHFPQQQEALATITQSNGGCTTSRAQPPSNQQEAHTIDVVVRPPAGQGLDGSGSPAVRRDRPQSPTGWSWLRLRGPAGRSHRIRRSRRKWH